MKNLYFSEVRSNYINLWIFTKEVGIVVKDIAMNAGGLGFKSLADLIGNSVANDSPPLRRFFGTVLARR